MLFFESFHSIRVITEDWDSELEDWDLDI